ncbi:uncharacterized protein LOC130546607 [Triplophysa rosa]|uniref:uncharacterized protein LOC130546607 n=1 Tax=Triplophysa rosa TaxID=992332 RepID=UPI0025460115|nr:uncharacterized protein LOC130546607 [Triplophysa rosa]
MKWKINVYKTTSSSVLTNGERIYMTHENGSISSFEECLAYIIKDYAFYVKNGNNCISLGPTTKKFRCALLDIAEDVQRMARNILNPPSHEMTGDEDNIFIRSSFVSLHGYIEKLSSSRMIHRRDGDVPVRDLVLRCGDKLIEASLWQDEALAELYEGAQILVTHLRATIKPNGRAKLNSSCFSSVELPDHPRTREWFTIIGILENEDDLVLLSDSFVVYSMSADLFPGTSSDLLERLPLNVEVEQANFRVHTIQYLEQ